MISDDRIFLYLVLRQWLDVFFTIGQIPSPKLNWINQIHRRKDSKSRTFGEKKGNSLSLTCSRQRVNDTEWAITITLLPELTGQLHVDTLFFFFFFFLPTKAFHHTTNGQGTPRILCVLLTGYPNKSIKFCVKGLNLCLLFFHFKLLTLIANPNLLYSVSKK